MIERARTQSAVPSVEITGMGIVCSIGHDLATFTQALRQSQSGIQRLALKTMPALAVDIGAEITGFDFAQRLNELTSIPESLASRALQLGRRAPFTIQTSIISALQAWSQANLSTGAIAPERLGLIIAGHNTTQNYQYSLTDSFRQHPEYLSPRHALQFMDTNQLGVLSEMLNIRGEGFLAGAASASGNVGVIQGARLIQNGVVDVCLVVGVVADLSPIEIQSFHTIGAMGGKHFRSQPTKACRPFDALHEGFIYGQASACVVLESATHAERRNAASLGRFLGGAIKLHATATTEPNVTGEIEAMQAALKASGLDSAQIDYLNTHGSSSPLGDRTEIEAIKAVFNQNFSKLWLNSTKSFTGHCLFSAGVVELVSCIVQMRKGFLHANLNLEQPIDLSARFCAATSINEKVQTAMSNSFGFGGINTSIVLQSVN